MKDQQPEHDCEFFLVTDVAVHACKCDHIFVSDNSTQKEYVPIEQTASLQKQVEEQREEIERLREELKFEKSRRHDAIVLLAREFKQKHRIAELEEALKELYSFTPDLHSSKTNWEGDFHKAILKAKKALNPQDNQK